MGWRGAGSLATEDCFVVAVSGKVVADIISRDGEVMYMSVGSKANVVCVGGETETSVDFFGERNLLSLAACETLQVGANGGERVRVDGA